MITELKNAILKVEQLKEEDQQEIARFLEDEIKWDNTLQSTQNELSNLASEALHEYKLGKTKQQDW